jgi:hypothetical protein
MVKDNVRGDCREWMALLTLTYIVYSAHDTTKRKIMVALLTLAYIVNSAQDTTR